MNGRTKILAAVTAALVLIGLVRWLSGGGELPPPPVAAPHAAAALPASRPAHASAPFALPAEYAVFQTRNPFSPSHAVAAGVPGSEAALVFDGAARDGGIITALIEDSTTHQVTRVGVGDKLARGRVSAIDLDSLTYAVAAASRRITPGQNLLGVLVPPPPPPPKAPPAPEGMPPGQGPGGPIQMGPNGPIMPNGLPNQGRPPRNRGPSEG